jgi:hypothetical protein
MVANLNTTVIYHRILTLENAGTGVDCCSIFITLALGVNVIKRFSAAK